MLIELQGNLVIGQNESGLLCSATVGETVHSEYRVRGEEVNLRFGDKAQVHLNIFEAIEMQRVLAAAIAGYLNEYHKELIADE